MIDTHAHLNDKKLIDNLDQVILEAKDCGVETIFCVGYDLQSSKLANEISLKYDNVYAIVGVHPHDAKTYCEQVENELENIALANKKVIAIGEIGLDYHYDLSPREVQKQVFEKQLKLAKKLNLPIVIHTREAFGHTFEILEKNKDCLKKGGIMHCFSGGVDEAKKCFNLGLMISFGGSLTFDKTGELEKVLKNTPFNMFVLETDAPYLTPVPFRGKVNQPKYVKLVLQKVSNILNLTEQEVEQITNQNVKRMFNLWVMFSKKNMGKTLFQTKICLKPLLEIQK